MPVTPIIVLGVGGTGMKALLQLKKMIAELARAACGSFPRCGSCASTPTTSSAPWCAGRFNPDLRSRSIRSNEYLKLEIPGNVGYDDLDRASAWFPASSSISSPTSPTGCKQYKSLGRLLFAWNYGKLLQPRRAAPRHGGFEASQEARRHAGRRPARFRRLVGVRRYRGGNVPRRRLLPSPTSGSGSGIASTPRSAASWRSRASSPTSARERSGSAATRTRR